jgi:pantetheine-phosphate adenylyltransferase
MIIVSGENHCYNNIMKKYKLAALGGTFDHFHKGHQTLINHAFRVAEKIIVGITTDDFLRNKGFSEIIEPQNKRQKSVADFVNSIDKSEQLEIISLENIFGPTLDDKNIDCLIVSPLTEKGAKLINQTRVEKDLSQLPIEICKLEVAQDGKHISSTRIRQGEINRDGFLYEKIFDKDIQISQDLREALKLPLGDLLQNNVLHQLENILSDNFCVAVGDITALYCWQNKLPVSMFVFDNKEKRLAIEKSIKHFIPSSSLLTCQNPAGNITVQLIESLKNALKNGNNVQVEGEEDLAVLPLILMLPLESKILYGQPDEGIVVVNVSEERKEWIRKMLNSS